MPHKLIQLVDTAWKYPKSLLTLREVALYLKQWCNLPLFFPHSSQLCYNLLYLENWNKEGRYTSVHVQITLLVHLSVKKKEKDGKHLTHLSVCKTSVADLVKYICRCLYFMKLMRKKEILLKHKRFFFPDLTPVFYLCSKQKHN